MQQLYHEVVEKALSKGDVELLVEAWAKAPYLGKSFDYTVDGEEKGIRELITEAIPTLARFHKINYHGNSFREFVELYDEAMLDRDCDLDPESCLIFFAKKGHKKGALLSISRGADNLEQALRAAALHGRVTLIREILWPRYVQSETETERERFLSLVVHAAVESGDLGTVLFFFDEAGVRMRPVDLLRSITVYGHQNLLEHFFPPDRKHRLFDYSIPYAAKGGFTEMVLYMLRNGASTLNGALSGAAEAGNEELIKLILKEEGEVTIGVGLGEAVQSGHTHLVKFFLEGPFEIDAYGMQSAVKTAVGKRNLEMLSYFLTKGEEVIEWILQAAVAKNYQDIVEYVRDNLSRSQFGK